jgi:hypothetical protein
MYSKRYKSVKTKVYAERVTSALVKTADRSFLVQASISGTIGEGTLQLLLGSTTSATSKRYEEGYGRSDANKHVEVGAVSKEDLR